MGSKYSKIARNQIDPIKREKMKKSLLIAMRIHELRHKYGYTQKDLAKKLDVPPSLVSKWLSGFQNITMETVERMEAIFMEPILSVVFEENLSSDSMNSTFIKSLAHHHLGTSNIKRETSFFYSFIISGSIPLGARLALAQKKSLESINSNLFTKIVFCRGKDLEDCKEEISSSNKMSIAV